MKQWQKNWLINKRLRLQFNLTVIIIGLIFIIQPSIILGQISPSNFISENSSFLIDFTQAPTANDQANVVSTSLGLMPLRQDIEGYYVSGIESIPLSNPRPFQTLTTIADINNYDPSVVSILVRFSADQVVWDDWQKLDEYHEEEQPAGKFMGNMIFLDTIYRYFSYMIEFKQAPATSPIASVTELQFNFFSPGDVAPASKNNISGTTISGMNSDCGCDLPEFATRSDWNCPDGNNPSCQSPEYTQVSHLIVHHSAGTNTSNNWAAVVLSIWDLHVNGNNWCDIGYNWLIDPNGIIYEGRGGGNNTKGAHFCGKNSGTMGICLLGNFKDATPTVEALASLEKLLTWKSCDVNLNPQSTTLHQSSNKNLQTISGHQNGCSTVCPGENLYPLLPQIRTHVKTELDICKNNSTDLEEEILINESLKIFPNPNQGDFQVYWESALYQKGIMLVYNALGEEVYREDVQIYPGSQQKSVQLSAFPAGVYQLRLHTQNFDLNRKVVIYSR